MSGVLLPFRTFASLLRQEECDSHLSPKAHLLEDQSLIAVQRATWKRRPRWNHRAPRRI